MKTLLALLLIYIPATAFAYGPYDTDIVRVLDGDTVEVMLHILPGLTKTTKLRINGINTPESTWRGKCDKEKALGLVAKKRLIELLEQRVSVSNIEEGKYAGRLLGTIDVDGVNVGQTLIDEGLARPYFGKAKLSWCD